ncbi:MAG: hypothetical protein H6722_06650 [Sandaracinus sp.]|nr:hypothetical protein [Sandaracinus sp.]MCB9612118.1 hypothetical protein [Sandaracinus sp.]MCB9623478.1 hypothetical protein [Sandaracinus sp.]
MSARTEPSIAWVFDELPPSEARRGGDPASHAFRPELATFVREVVQNANDQAQGFPRVHFRFLELEGEALARFRVACAWDSLVPHLRAAASRDPALAEQLAAFETRLPILIVEDFNTRGLEGAEDDEDSHFRALCKDTLFSHKAAEGAGGSYGLGKSVLWTFSGLRTVLFGSHLLHDPPGHTSPRLFGRVELASHRVDGRARGYAGSGWLGCVVKTKGGARAESVWDDDAATRLAELGVDRRQEHQLGTSALVVGFRDPASDTDREREESLVARIRDASARYFWPASVMENRKLRVFAEGREPSMAAYAPFVDAYVRRTEPSRSLDGPRDVVTRTLRVAVPKSRDGAEAVDGEVDLVVRLAGRGESVLSGHVAFFRGPGMVVRYLDRSLVAPGRSFHALLVAGEARAPLSPSESDRAVERFLRSAEPPGHDEWTTTPHLKQRYQRGYLKALTQLHKDVDATLRDLLVPKLGRGERGPEALRRRFPIGKRGGRSGTESAFRFEGLTVRWDTERWRFEGSLGPATRVHRGWSAEVRLLEVDEDGRVVGSVEVETITSPTQNARVDVQDGLGRLHAPAGARVLPFQGASAPLAEPMGALVLEVGGRLRSEDTP